MVAVCGDFSSWRWFFNWLYDEKLGEQGRRCKLRSCSLACLLILVFAACLLLFFSLSRFGPDIHLQRRKSVLENIRCYFFVKQYLVFKLCLSAFFQAKGKLDILLKCTLFDNTMSHVNWSANMLEIFWKTLWPYIFFLFFWCLLRPWWACVVVLSYSWYIVCSS